MSTLITGPGQLFRPEYHRPTKIREAITYLQHEGAVPMCGGTDVLVEKNPDTRRLVDLSRLPLNYIKPMRNGILIGATTTVRQIENSPLFNSPTLTILRDAVRDFGTVQIRNMATIGGNLCNGIPSADLPPPLIALDTTAKLKGPNGQRKLLLEKLYLHVRKLALKRGELLTELKISTPPLHTAAAYLRLSRSIVDISLVAAAVRITLDEGNRVAASRIVLGAVAPTPLRAKKAENYLNGKKLSPDTLGEASRVAALESKPINDVRATAKYRREMVAVLVDRAISRAVSRIRKDPA